MSYEHQHKRQKQPQTALSSGNLLQKWGWWVVMVTTDSVLSPEGPEEAQIGNLCDISNWFVISHVKLQAPWTMCTNGAPGTISWSKESGSRNLAKCGMGRYQGKKKKKTLEAPRSRTSWWLLPYHREILFWVPNSTLSIASCCLNACRWPQGALDKAVTIGAKTWVLDCRGRVEYVPLLLPRARFGSVLFYSSWQHPLKCSLQRCLLETNEVHDVLNVADCHLWASSHQ